MSEHPVYDAILARRSIRRFQDKPVPRELAERLLHAAMAAPSACNLQPWAFIAVDAPDILAQLRTAASQGDYNAPLAIVVCGVSGHIPWDGEGWRQDCGGAAQNIMLACVEIGLASVCIGGFEENALRATLNIPEGVEPMCIIEIGYPAYERPPLTWYTPAALHWQVYDNKKPRTLRTMQMLRDDIASGLL